MGKTSKMRGLLLAAAGSAVVAASTLFPVACSSSSSPAATPDSGGGGHSSTTSTKTSTSSKTTTSSSSSKTNPMHDSGAEDAPKGMTDSGVEDAPKAFTCASDAGPATGTLYERLGGHAGIRAALDAIVAAELANADIASYFFYQSDAGYKEGHPNGDQIEECFTDFVGKAAGGPELYPTTLTADAGNGGAAYTCRELSVAHRDLEINQGTYDEFLGIAAMVLGANGVCGADIATLAGALESTGDGGVASAIITSVKKSDGGEKFPGNVAADLKLDATY